VARDVVADDLDALVEGRGRRGLAIVGRGWRDIEAGRTPSACSSIPHDPEERVTGTYRTDAKHYRRLSCDAANEERLCS
jgi:hypothetical protein